MKRKLTNEEMMLCNKSLQARKEELEWIDYQLLYHNLMLRRGLDMNHKKNVRDFKAKEREFKAELEMIKDVIKTLQSQIRDGVEIIEEKDKKEEKK